MTFIIVLISLIIERFFHWTHLRNWRWFTRYQLWLNTQIPLRFDWFLLMVCILPLLIIVGLIDFLLTGWFYNILKLLFDIGVLMYCLGPSNLWVQTYACINALHAEDPQHAIECAQKSFKIKTPDNSKIFHELLTRAIFIKAYRRLFAVLFWFVFLGPVGAVFYRTLTLNTKESSLGTTQLAKKTLRVIDWIPVRLFTFLFALGGHFTAVFPLWKKSFRQGLDANNQLLGDCGIAAIDNLSEDGAAEKESIELLDRVFVIGLVILAVFSLVIP